MSYDDQLDRALAKEQEILPSSGFASGVMEAVKHEASAPPPIPFPWKRALPGMIAAVLAIAFVAGATIAILVGGGGARSVSLPAEELSVVHAVQHLGGGWIALALLISFACVKITSSLGWNRG